jgi:hypothetical protein
VVEHRRAATKHQHPDEESGNDVENGDRFHAPAELEHSRPGDATFSTASLLKSTGNDVTTTPGPREHHPRPVEKPGRADRERAWFRRVPSRQVYRQVGFSPELEQRVARRATSLGLSFSAFVRATLTTHLDETDRDERVRQQTTTFTYAQGGPRGT